MDIGHAQTPTLPHVLLSHGRELLLTRGVQDVENTQVMVDLRVLDIRVLNRRVVIRDEELLEELNGERRLADLSLDES